MLALTRKKGESIILNNDIEISILELRGDQVKVGISAPKEVPVYRKEVYLQIQKENEAASSAESLAALKEIL
ncbi:translational regulator CsrA [Lachnospiraceae bacterium]|jgi:carbon storage regulator|nr:carbon storage regulator CsrA [Lachnospiraceae bacterium]MCI9058975.1 carbon storage regulator CsrA [Lachnospiraceae bacterium]GFI29523.1 translational regulator CsrA [Lachnospiraceae bacterium]